MKRKKHLQGLNHDERYQKQFGQVSDQISDRITSLLVGRLQNRIKDEIDKVVNDVNKIKKKKITLIWYTEPHPSQRPRLDRRRGYVHMYVPLAAETRLEFVKFLSKKLPSFKPIDTPMEYHVKAYLKTPVAFSRTLKVLAEMGIYRPWGRHSDADNLYKAYTDCAIGSLITDDGLIDDMRSQKFYSIKPRVEINITYYERWPIGLKPITNTPNHTAKEN